MSDSVKKVRLVWGKGRAAHAIIRDSFPAAESPPEDSPAAECVAEGGWYREVHATDAELQEATTYCEAVRGYAEPQAGYLTWAQKGMIDRLVDNAAAQHVVPVACDCTHDGAFHDPVSGACLQTNPIHGPCPCAATPDSTRKALTLVHKALRTIAALACDVCSWCGGTGEFAGGICRTCQS